MELNEHRQAKWKGRNLSAKVLYSRAGVAQNIWIENDIGTVLIDCADGIIRDVLANKLEFSRLSAICITHGHFDHMGGMRSLLGFIRMIGREETLPVFAPEGCIEVFSTISNFMHNYPDSIPFKIDCLGLQNNEKVTAADMTIEAFAVIHCGSTKADGITDAIPAMGYKISYKEESIVITGDTGSKSDLERYIAGADLAIIEATFTDASEVTAEMISHVHLTEEIAWSLGEKAKDYILVHTAK